MASTESKKFEIKSNLERQNDIIEVEKSLGELSSKLVDKNLSPEEKVKILKDLEKMSYKAERLRERHKEDTLRNISNEASFRGFYKEFLDRAGLDENPDLQEEARRLMNKGIMRSSYINGMNDYYDNLLSAIQELLKSHKEDENTNIRESLVLSKIADTFFLGFIRKAQFRLISRNLELLDEEDQEEALELVYKFKEEDEEKDE